MAQNVPEEQSVLACTKTYSRELSQPYDSECVCTATLPSHEMRNDMCEEQHKQTNTKVPKSNSQSRNTH